MEKESGRLAGLLGLEYGKMAATGGRMIDDLYGQFPEIGWDVLTGTFLGTGK